VILECRVPLDVFQDKLNLAGELQAIKDRNNVRMVKACEQVRFPQQTLSILPGSRFAADGLKGYDPVQAALAGAIDDGQAIVPGYTQDVVAGQDLWFIIIGSSGCHDYSEQPSLWA